MDTLAGTAPPIRIVPLRERIAAAPATTPTLTYRGGPLLASVEVSTTYWGSAWDQASLKPQIAQLDGFFSYIVTSTLIDQLGEYSVDTVQIVHGSYIGSSVLTSDPSSSLQDADIQAMLRDRISSGQVPPTNPNSLYFVFLPPGVTVTMSGQRSCQAVCGYHDSFDTGVFYAVMPYPDCSGCSAGMDAFSALTVTSSHELCEGITDPVPGQRWYDDNNGEIGDICAWQTKDLGGHQVQLEWSNSRASCV